MARPRSNGRRDLPKGLYRDTAGRFYAKHPTTRRQVSLETRDPKRARKLFDMLMREWQSDVDQVHAQRLSGKIQGAQIPGAESVAGFAERWRTERLPTLKSKGGKPLAEGTKKGYDGFLRREIVPNDQLRRTRLADADAQLLRQFLRRWIDTPSTYNQMLACLSRMFSAAVDEGLAARSPMRDIERRGTAKRETYVTDEQYTAIIQKVEAGAGYKDRESEWIARAIDFVYLVSHNPRDVLGIREDQITEYAQPETDDSGVAIYGELLVTRGKTGQAVIIFCNADLWDLIDWFREWKRRHRLISEHLVCYPPKAVDRRHTGQAPSVEYISRRFTAAVRAAGLTDITLRDLRPKGLSDEWITAGDSDKGGHKTQAMKDHYRRIKLPMKARSNLRRIGGTQQKNGR